MAAPRVTSPRLPSPPPLTEDFIHPKSPISLSEDQANLENASKVDHGASRRIRPGTKAADMAEGPPVVELIDIDSSFAFTEHLKALHNAAIHPDLHTVNPIDREAAGRLATPPDGVDNAAWLHELCRFLCQRVNAILVALFADNPPCSSHTCPEMRASEWQYLCAVHDPPKSCCAIDYCCHTLDWAATTLTSVKNFPSYGMGKPLDGSNTVQLRQLTNVFRRVYRIFAHAWFQHREVFWQVEHRTGLYVFFKTVCDAYSLIPEDNYTIPPEAEGIEVKEEVQVPQDQPTLLRREAGNEDGQQQEEKPEALLGAGLGAGNTTKRHRHSPSTGATAVDTVIEETEEDDTSAGHEKVKQEEAQAIKEDSLDNETTPVDSKTSEAQLPTTASSDVEHPTELPASEPVTADQQPTQEVPTREKEGEFSVTATSSSAPQTVGGTPEAVTDDKDEPASQGIQDATAAS